MKSLWEKASFYVHSRNDAMQLLQAPTIQKFDHKFPHGEMSVCQYSIMIVNFKFA